MRNEMMAETGTFERGWSGVRGGGWKVTTECSAGPAQGSGLLGCGCAGHASAIVLT